MKSKERITSVKIAQRRRRERERYGKVLTVSGLYQRKFLTDSEKNFFYRNRSLGNKKNNMARF
jgi:hypothetical protein